MVDFLVFILIGFSFLLFFLEFLLLLDQNINLHNKADIDGLIRNIDKELILKIEDKFSEWADKIWENSHSKYKFIALRTQKELNIMSQNSKKMFKDDKKFCKTELKKL